MQTSSIRFLNQLNQEFYENIAESFDDSRSYSWQGWENLKPYIHKIIEGKKRNGQVTVLRVLDIGCGNGRFSNWLSELLHTTGSSNTIEYTGIDFNQSLLQKAQEKTSNLDHVSTSFEKIDIIENLLENKPLTTKKNEVFDLIVCFGVLHHIPGQEMRKALVGQIAELLVKSEKTATPAPQGLACVAAWKFDTLPNLFSRAQNLQTSDFIPDPEVGDFLLDWKRVEKLGPDSKSPTHTMLEQKLKNPRFCHLISDQEVSSWWPTTNLMPVLHYLADGPNQQSNSYWILNYKPQ